MESQGYEFEKKTYNIIESVSKAEGGFSLDLKSANKELKAVTPEK